MGFDALQLSLPYFEWIEQVVFPILGAVLHTLIVLFGIGLNSMMLRAFRKFGTLNVPSILQLVTFLAVLDIVVCIVVVIPIIVAECLGSFPVGDIVCNVLGFIQIWTLTAHMWALVIFSCERAFYLRNKMSHKRWWGSLARWRIASVLIIACTVVVPIIPFFDLGEYKYISNQHQCTQYYSKTPWLVLVNSATIFILPALVSLCFCADGLCTIRFRQSDTDLTDKADGTSMTTVGVTSSSQRHKVVVGHSSGNVTSRSFEKGADKLTEALAIEPDLFNSENSDAEQQMLLCCTFICLGCCLLQLAPWTCYLLEYSALYNSAPPVYDAVWTSVVFLSNIIWVLKPIVYFSYNKQIRSMIRKSYSKKTRRNVRKTIKNVNKAIDKLDTLVFSPVLKQAKVVANVVVAKRYARIWKRRAQEIIEERRSEAASASGVRPEDLSTSPTPGGNPTLQTSSPPAAVFSGSGTSGF